MGKHTASKDTFIGITKWVYFQHSYVLAFVWMSKSLHIHRCNTLLFWYFGFWSIHIHTHTYVSKDCNTITLSFKQWTLVHTHSFKQRHTCIHICVSVTHKHKPRISNEKLPIFIIFCLFVLFFVFSYLLVHKVVWIALNYFSSAVDYISCILMSSHERLRTQTTLMT